jgi:hypothetical protein
MSKPSLDLAAGHSAEIQMWLHIDGRKLEVLQSGEGAIKLNRATVVPAGTAILEIVVDGRPHRREIRIVSTATNTGWLAISDLSPHHE